MFFTRKIAYGGALLLLLLAPLLKPLSSALLFFLFGITLLLYLRKQESSCKLLLLLLPVYPLISLLGDLGGIGVKTDSPITAVALICLSISLYLLFTSWKRATTIYVSSILLALPFSMAFSSLAATLTHYTEGFYTVIAPLTSITIMLAIGTLFFLYEAEKKPQDPPLAGAPLFIAIFFVYLNMRELISVWNVPEIEGGMHERLRFFVVLFSVELSIAFLLFSHLLYRLRFEAYRTRHLASSMQTILNSSFEAILTLDRRGKVLYANAPSKEILGYEPDALIGNYLFSFLRLKDNGMIDAVLAGEKSVIKSLETIKRPDGQEIHLTFACRSIEDENNENEAIVVLHDTSQEALFEGQLLQALSKVRNHLLKLKEEQKNEILAKAARREFLTKLSENLRALTKECGPDLSIRLEEFLGKLPGVLEIGAGKFEVHYEPIELDGLINSVAEGFSLSASLHRNFLKIETASLPQWILGDRNILETIFSELFQYALQQAEKEIVTLTGNVLQEEEFTATLGFTLSISGGKTLSKGLQELELLKELVALHDGTLEILEKEGVVKIILSVDKER